MCCLFFSGELQASSRPDGSDKELLSRLVTYLARNACQTHSQSLQDSEGDIWGLAVLSEELRRAFWISRPLTSSDTLANEWIWVMMESILYVLVANIESEILVDGKSDIFPQAALFLYFNMAPICSHPF